MTRRLLPGLLAAALGASGCGNDAPQSVTGPSAADTSVDRATRLFTGTVGPGAAAYYSFTIAQQSGVFLTLASLTSLDGRETGGVVALGLGVPRGTTCELRERVMTPAALAPQIQQTVAAGVHCVSVEAPLTLAGERRFGVRIGFFQ